MINTFDLIREELGVITNLGEHGYVTITGGGIEQICKNNPSRVELFIRTSETQQAYISFLRDYTAYPWFVLNPPFGSIYFWWKEDYSIVTREFFVYTASDVTIQWYEVVLS